MINSMALITYKQNSIDEIYIPAELLNEIKQWAYVICLPIAGLLVLAFFISLGGVFAIAGPWAVFAAVKLLNKYMDDQTRKAQQTLRY